MIRYTTFDTEVGTVLVAATDQGIAALGIGRGEAELVAWLGRKRHGDQLQRADKELRPCSQAVRRFLRGESNSDNVSLDLRGTDFQKRVWRELQRIPRGQTRTYAEVAAAIGKPSAARAVARACATNPVSLFVPCHRVVRTGGALGGYGWGLDRKRRLLELERPASS